VTDVHGSLSGDREAIAPNSNAHSTWVSSRNAAALLGFCRFGGCWLLLLLHFCGVFFFVVVFRGVYKINSKLPRTSALGSWLLMLPKLICFHLCVPA